MKTFKLLWTVVDICTLCDDIFLWLDAVDSQEAEESRSQGMSLLYKWVIVQ